MNKLRRKEEVQMMILWEMGKGFVKDILEEYAEPKPHYNTVSTLVRVMQEKGFIDHRQFGNTHEYYPVISKEQYRRHFIRYVIQDYFNNSYEDVVAYFVEEKNLITEELEGIIRMVKHKKP